MGAPDATLAVLQNALCQLADAAERTAYNVDLCLMHDQCNGWRLIMRHSARVPRSFYSTVLAITEEYDLHLTAISLAGIVEGFEFHLLPTLAGSGLPSNITGS